MFGFTIVSKRRLKYLEFTILNFSENMAVECTNAYEEGYKDGYNNALNIEYIPKDFRKDFELGSLED